MSIELINWLLGGGGLLSIVTLIINSVMQKKKNKLDNLDKETTIFFQKEICCHIQIQYMK